MAVANSRTRAAFNNKKPAHVKSCCKACGNAHDSPLHAEACGHAHHWLLEAPEGPISEARCKIPGCKATTQFRNGFPKDRAEAKQ